MAGRQNFLLFAFLLGCSTAVAAQGSYAGVPFALGSALSVSPDSQSTEYFINITLGGQNFSVVMDTGSSDLWVRTTQPLKLTNNSGLFGNLMYGSGTDQLSGPIQFAELKIGEYTIPSQAFVNVDTVEKGDLPYDGLIGLSFDRVDMSPIEEVIKNNWGNDSTLGRIVYSNIIAQNMSLQPFYDISLGRAGDLNPVDEGNLIFGSHLPGYEAIAQAPVLSNVVPSRWTIYVDAMSVNGQNVPLGQSVSSATPQGKLVALVDTGTTTGSLPSALAGAIYSTIPGSVNSSGQLWFVPCAGAANVTFTIGGQEFPVHPLDLTAINNITLPVGDGTSANVTACTSRYLPNVKPKGVDLILGSAFLKNAYVSYNFGVDADRNQNGTGSYIQAISTTDQEAAWTDFLISRLSALQRSPFVVDPVLLDVLFPDNSSNSTSSNSTSPSTTSASSLSPVSSSTATTVHSGSSSPSATQEPTVVGALADVESTPSSNNNGAVISLLDKYGPVVIGLLAGNILVMTLLCLIAVVACTRSLKGKTGTRSVSSNYAPVSFKDSGIHEDSEFPVPVHSYGD